MTTAPAMICVSLRYADAPKIYDWLIDALGFEKHAAYYAPDGKTLLHGELRMGESFVMLGSAENNEFGKLVARPAELGGTTASPYIRHRRHRRPLRARPRSRSRNLHGTDRPALWQPRLHLQGSGRAYLVLWDVPAGRQAGLKRKPASYPHRHSGRSEAEARNPS
ncbi:hypothetical protein SAMN05216304_102234 [Bosea sp. OK403]|nr:hypothetical protein SAMN05216304_102234 [Bosea sp. OK403]